MNKLLLTATTSAFIALSFSTAHAVDLTPLEGFYISGFGGVVMEGHTKWKQGDVSSNEDFDHDLLSYGGAVGYDFGDYRFEGELSHLSAYGETMQSETHKLSSEISATALMVNAWYDVDTGTDFTPYVGGGVGAAEIEVDSTKTWPEGSFSGSGYSSTEYAYQVGTGVDYSVTEGATVGLGYKYLSAGDQSFHTVNAGMRYTF
jgi:opacity protein-like surface antigen